MFGGGAGPTCLKAADANNDSRYSIADALYILVDLFGGGPSPGSPHPSCGTDVNDYSSTLTCDFYNQTACTTATLSQEVDVNNKVTIESATATSDGYVTIPVSVETAQDVYGLQFTIKYDNNLEFMNFTRVLEANFFECRERGNTLKCGVVIDTNLKQTLPAGKHKVAEMMFKTVSNKNTQITLEDVELIDKDGNAIVPATEDARIGVGKRTGKRITGTAKQILSSFASFDEVVCGYEQSFK